MAVFGQKPSFPHCYRGPPFFAGLDSLVVQDGGTGRGHAVRPCGELAPGGGHESQATTAASEMGGGTNGLISLHCSSLKSLGYGVLSTPFYIG